MIKTIAAEVGGGGGGRPDMAQAGGTRPQHLDKALEKAKALIARG
jgi:alanyl-tRNA synthetase